MNATPDRERASRPNAIVRFARGFGALVHDYQELRETARRRFPDAFR